MTLDWQLQATCTMREQFNKWMQQHGSKWQRHLDYSSEKWKCEKFVCRYSDHAHPGIYSCLAEMRVRTKIDLSVAVIETARALNNHRPVKDNGLSEQMKEIIAKNEDKTASQIRKEIKSRSVMPKDETKKSKKRKKSGLTYVSKEGESRKSSKDSNEKASKGSTEEAKTETVNKSSSRSVDNISKALTINPWYHGMMPRDEIEELLKNDGDFLLRRTEVSHVPRYAISVLYKERTRHILLVFKEGVWSIRGLKKKTLTELIETHVKDKIPVMADGTLIKVGVARPDFYILHEHVIIKEKLGDGSFVLIVLELAPGGSLRSHLRKNPKITVDHLFKYVQDAARGMCYLSGRQIIHRDVAARNCLLGPVMKSKLLTLDLH
uniref:Tyrosine-protein kinase n=1 Tax=Ditylenchus dipsaci TaxID=166011 RepID=A0A915DQB2_9BILA